MFGAVIGRLLHGQVGFGSGQIGTGCRDSRKIRGIVDPEKRIPDLKFFLDEGAQRRERMDDLFAKIAADRGDDAPTEAEDETPSRGEY